MLFFFLLENVFILYSEARKKFCHTSNEARVIIVIQSQSTLPHLLSVSLKLYGTISVLTAMLGITRHLCAWTKWGLMHWVM